MYKCWPVQVWAAHKKRMYLRVSLKLKALARYDCKVWEGTVQVFRLLELSMLVAVPLLNILLDIHVAETSSL
jgi:hypothetical protein